MNTAAYVVLCIGGLIEASQGGVADSSSGRLIESLWLGNEISLLSRARAVLAKDGGIQSNAQGDSSP